MIDNTNIITLDKCSMNLRDDHRIDAKIIGRIPQYSKTQIDEIYQDGNNYWGRVSSSWLYLKLNNQYFTSWEL